MPTASITGAPRAPAAIRPASKVEHIPARPKPRLTVAVVITCHNYGRYLANAIESALGQTVPPEEIIVVDDSSTDETLKVTQLYPSVEYLWGTWRDVLQARLEGANRTTAPILCFLDADDMLGGDYIEKSIKQFHDPSVGVIYSNCQEFGATHKLRNYTPDALTCQNFAHAGSLVRRAAIELSGLNELTCPPECLEDWLMWRLIERDGWRFAKNEAIYHYRRHPTSRTKTVVDRSWQTHSPVKYEKLTLFIPLSGRTRYWPQLADYLSRQKFPHDRISLILCDTSRDAEFHQRIREWALGSDYSDVRIYQQEVPVPHGVADQDRRHKTIRQQVQLAVAMIYRRLLREATNNYVWVIEDDVIPPDNAASTLLSEFDADVISVSGCYRSPYHNGLIAWSRWGQNVDDIPDKPIEIEGNGFGCVIVRREGLHQFGINHTQPTADFDANLYCAVAEDSKWRVILHPDVVCDHLSIPARRLP